MGSLTEKFAETWSYVDEKFTDTRRHFDVITEGLEHKIQLVAEGVANVDEKLECFRQEVQEILKMLNP